MATASARPASNRTRRRVRGWIIAAIIIVAVIVGGLFAARSIGVFGVPTVSTVGQVTFDQPLAIPPLADSTVSEDGTRVFDLVAQQGDSEFTAGVQTATWGYNGSYLGPTLRAERGERVEINVKNELDQATTVHWHGMHLPAVMDGGPHQPVEPGSEWQPTWTVDQPASTLWYHPHPHEESEDQIRRGLAGMFIIDDPVESALSLPREYGVDDIPVIVQDAAFTDGALTERDGGYVGALGDTILVNGTVGPYLDVSTNLVRLRLLNASTARIYAFTFDDNRSFSVIASDGGLLAAPLEMNRIQLSPGERTEILVPFEPGDTAILRSEGPDLGATSPVFGGSNGGADRFDILELRSADRLDSAEMPTSLADVPRLEESDAVTTREFELNDTHINGVEMDMTRVDEVVGAGDVEIWTVRNTMAYPHNFHIHGVQFQVLDIAGNAPPDELAGWKDTVYIRPGDVYRLIVPFGKDVDEEHPYMYHCHLLRHEDLGMMGQFVIAEEGVPQSPPEDASTSDDQTHDGH